MKMFSNAPETPRRKFLKFVTFGTATSVLGGRLWQREVLAYCEPIPDQPQGIFKVRVSDYPALLQSFGSVRIGVNPLVDGDPFPNGNFYPILINRDEAGKFYALDCECRHQSCVVPPFDPAQQSIQCQCHGSQYWIDGSVLSGPTTAPLGEYKSEFDGADTLTIHIPCWAFQINASVLPGGPTSRIKIDFYANPNVTYEVSFRQQLENPWTGVSFATTPTGAANQNSLLGADEN